MTKQDNISIRSGVQLVSNIVLATFLVIMGIVTSSSSENNVYGQAMNGDHGGGVNMSSETVGNHSKLGIKGMINIGETPFETIDSKANTSLTQAMIIAERSIGNNSIARAAFGNVLSGTFVYQIILSTPTSTPTMKLYNVWVDPGNGKILAAQETSKKELERMHFEHSSEVVRGSHSDEGMPLWIPH